MKKVLLLSVVAVAMMVVSCGSPKVYGEAMTSMRASMSQVDSIQTMDQLQAFSAEFGQAQTAFSQNPDWAKVTEADMTAYTSLGDSLATKLAAKGQELAQKAAEEAAAAAAVAAAEAEAAATAKPGKK